MIWIDADACPKLVKEAIFKASGRLNHPVTLVANSSQNIPREMLVKLVIVGKGDDIADQYIIENVKANELVITADIPLAAKVIEKNALVINPRGEIYTEENIGEILSMRNFLKDMRDSGSITGGPASYGPKDIQSFTNSLNQILTKYKF